MDSVIFTVFGYDIKWYSVLILVAIIIAVSMLLKEGHRFNISKEFLINLAFWTIIFGIIGARLYYCIFNYNLYKDNPIEILYIWNGGLAIHGGLIAGLITIIVYCHRYGVSFTKITDMTVVPLLLAQAIGRWGNFFNSEAYGSAVQCSYLSDTLHLPNFIVEGMTINGECHLPMFLFESIFCLIGFLILLILRRYKYIKRGQLTCLYMIYYGVGRFFIESYRTDSLMLGGFKVAQIVSIIMVVIGVMAFMIISRKGRFEDLYNEDQKGPIRF